MVAAKVSQSPRLNESLNRRTASTFSCEIVYSSNPATRSASP